MKMKMHSNRENQFEIASKPNCLWSARDVAHVLGLARAEEEEEEEELLFIK